MQRITWSESEKNTFFSECERLLKVERRPVKTIFPLAQLVLPVSRQRLKWHCAINAKTNKQYQKWIQDGMPGFNNPSGPNPDSTDIIVIEKEKITVKEPDYGMIPTVTLVRVLCERLANLEETIALLNGLQDKLLEKRAAEAAYDSRLDSRPTPKTKSHIKPIRVCVLGISPQLIAPLKESAAKLPKPLELSFRTGTDFTKEPPSAVDFLIVTGDAAGKWLIKARNVGASDRILECDPSLENLVKKLYDIASRQ